MWFEVFVGCVIEWSKPPLSGAHVPAVPRYHRFRKIPKIGPEKKLKKKIFRRFRTKESRFHIPPFSHGSNFEKVRSHSVRKV